MNGGRGGGGGGRPESLPLLFCKSVYFYTVISFRLIVYYLIIANSGGRPSFAIYRTIYDSPLGDNIAYPTTSHGICRFIPPRGDYIPRSEAEWDI